MRSKYSLWYFQFILSALLSAPFILISSNKSETFLKQQNSKTCFIENKGQIIDQNNKPNPAVIYLLNMPGMNVQLRKGGFSYDLYQVSHEAPGKSDQIGNNNESDDWTHDLSRQPSSIQHPASSIQFHRIDINLQGSNPECQIIPSDPLTDYFNYFTASAPPEGIKNVRQYSKITYINIYPDIDLEFFTNEEHGHKYNFVIHSGGNIRDIRLTIDGPEHISLIQDTLKFGTRFGDVEELIPESYYLVNDTRVEIQARFKKINNEVYGFSVNKPVPGNSLLVIDPTAIRLWGTYYGGTGWDSEPQCSADKAGNVFLAGITNSLNNIASAGSYQDTFAGTYDGFLVKFDAAGQRKWGTYFGGIELEDLASCVVDKSGNIYVSGDTRSTSGIASPGAHQTMYGGGQYDCYIEKFNQAGDRLWGTYYGGANTDYWGTVTTDKNGNVFLTGQTSSDTGIATPGSYQPNRYNTSTDAFLAKFDSNGVRQWGTYYGGEMGDINFACTTDGSGNLYFSGTTSSQTNIASPGAYQTIYGGAPEDAFLAKFTTGGQRVWATYYGGSNEEQGYGCTAESAGNVLLIGKTNSPNGISSPGCHQPVYGGGPYDAFIVKFDSLGQRLWGTYYGGTDNDQGWGCTFGWNGDIFLVGWSVSLNNISTTDSYQLNFGGIVDGFLVKFNAGGQRQWGTYYGGSATDEFLSASYVSDDTLYLAGYTYSTNNITSPGAWQEVYGGARDDMLIKFIECWPIDTAGPISGSVNVCTPSTGVNYSIPPLAHAVNYVWTIPPGFTISSGAGTQSVFVDISASASSGTIWVKGVNKCNDPGDSAYLFITVSPAPVPVIFGPNITCAGSGKIYTTAFGNANYQWSVSSGGVITSGGTTTDNTVTVTWNTVGTEHVYLNYTDANGCSAQTPTDYVVQVTPSPAVSIAITATLNNVCSGTQVTFNSTSSNGGGNPSYLWQVNGINAGTNTSTFSYTPLNNDVVRCILTSSITGCIMNNPDTSNFITMIVNPILPVSISINTPDNPFCQGTTVTFTATPNNEGSAPIYHWFVNGINVGANNLVFSYNPSNGDIIYCVLNSSVPCPTGNPATSNAITMIENTNVTVSVSITPSENPVCEGTPVTFTAAPTSPGSAPVYQWKVNGTNVGTNSSTYSYVPANGDLVSCVLTSNAACASGNPATSNTITMVVNPNLPVSITVTASQNPVCSGSTVTFTANPVNEGTTPSFQWKVNGTAVGTNLSTYSYIPLNGDMVTCIVNSNATCAVNNPATSPPVTMTVNPNLVVSVSIAASANPFCAGSSVTFTATPNNGGTLPTYQWKVNGIGVGPNNQVYSYFPNNGDVVSCDLNSNITCPLGNPATSNPITMIVNANLPAGVTITASSNPFCPGSSVTFTAIPVNGGSTPSYQWKVNGVNTGTNSSTYSYNPANNDSVRCIMTSNLSCVTGNPVSSAKIFMNGTLAPIVTFTSCFDTITTINAKPIKLKGGIPLNGVYSGPGVNSLTGVYTPALAGVGTHTITYTYTNAALCSALAHAHIINYPLSIVNCGNPITDIRDNKIYQTVQIGSQCWLASNLNYGTILVSSQDQRDNCISEKYCYNDIPTNCTNQGGLYQWDELMLFDETPAGQGFCPPGWHIPTENDWNILFGNYINSGFAGSPLKYSGYSGFNALLSGARHINRGWDFQGFATYFWSSTPRSDSKAWAHGMNDADPSVSLYPSLRVNAFSVRCLKD